MYLLEMTGSVSKHENSHAVSMFTRGGGEGGGDEDIQFTGVNKKKTGDTTFSADHTPPSTVSQFKNNVLRNNGKQCPHLPAYLWTTLVIYIYIYISKPCCARLWDTPQKCTKCFWPRLAHSLPSFWLQETNCLHLESKKSLGQKQQKSVENHYNTVQLISWRETHNGMVMCEHKERRGFCSSTNLWSCC